MFPPPPAAMEETPAASPLKKRLATQNEVLKWLEKFSEKLQKRANDTTVEIQGLLDEAGAVELDLKNTFNFFRNLSYHRFIDHKISDDAVYDKKENARSSAEGGITAQNYETDILPRYREALSLGLNSCRNYLQNTQRCHSSNFTSGWKNASAFGLLPHIIGSEEYIHDNSCGLAEDHELGTPSLDFNFISDLKGVPSDSEVQEFPGLFGPCMSEMHEGSSGKDGTETLVTAALDFKAMLEAALLIPYKLYDDEALLVHNAIDDNRSKQTNKDENVATSGASEAVLFGSPDHVNVAEEKIMPVTEKNPSPQEDSDTHAHALYSALIAGSLFDNEEGSLDTNQVHSANMPASAAESIFGHVDNLDDNKLVEGFHSLDIHEAPYSNDGITEQADSHPTLSIDEEKCKDFGVMEKDTAYENSPFFPCKLKGDASSSLMDNIDVIGATEELCKCDQSFTNNSKGKLFTVDLVKDMGRSNCSLPSDGTLFTCQNISDCNIEGSSTSLSGGSEKNDAENYVSEPVSTFGLTFINKEASVISSDGDSLQESGLSEVHDGLTGEPEPCLPTCSGSSGLSNSSYTTSGKILTEESPLSDLQHKEAKTEEECRTGSEKEEPSCSSLGLDSVCFSPKVDLRTIDHMGNSDAADSIIGESILDVAGNCASESHH